MPGAVTVSTEGCVRRLGWKRRGDRFWRAWPARGGQGGHSREGMVIQGMEP